MYNHNMIRILTIIYLAPLTLHFSAVHLYYNIVQHICNMSILSLAADCDLDIPEECDQNFISTKILRKHLATTITSYCLFKTLIRVGDIAQELGIRLCRGSETSHTKGPTLSTLWTFEPYSRHAYLSQESRGHACHRKNCDVKEF